MDVARLGVTVDTRQVVTANRDLDGLAKAADEVGIKVKTVERVAKETAPAIERVGGAAETTSRKVKVMASEMDEAKSSGAGLRVGMQQFSYQVADVATQVQMGTSALSAISVQMAQFLGVFGVWGAVAGGAVAIGGALWNSFVNVGDGASDAADAVDGYRKQLEALDAEGDRYKQIMIDVAPYEKAHLQALVEMADKADAAAASHKTLWQSIKDAMSAGASVAFGSGRAGFLPSGAGSLEARAFLGLDQAWRAQPGPPGGMSDDQISLRNQLRQQEELAARNRARNKEAADASAVRNVTYGPAGQDYNPFGYQEDAMYRNAQEARTRAAALEAGRPAREAAARAKAEAERRRKEAEEKRAAAEYERKTLAAGKNDYNPFPHQEAAMYRSAQQDRAQRDADEAAAQRKLEADATKAANELLQEQERQVQANRAAFEQYGNAAVSALMGVVRGSQTAGQALASLLEQFAQMAIQAGIAGFANYMFPGAGTAAAAAAGTAANTQQRAAGGPTVANTPYLVGEHGPEIFHPGQSGYVQPNTPRAGGAPTPAPSNQMTISAPLTVNLSGGATPQDAAMISAAVERRISTLVDQRLVSHAKSSAAGSASI